MLILVEPGAHDMGAQVRYVIIEDVEVGPPEAVEEGVERLIADFKAGIPSLRELAEHPHVKAYRSLFWRMKVDPTKMRPSPEALARRILRGRGVPRINSVVDAGNAASLNTLVSIGLYDLDRVGPPLRVAVLRGGTFHPIGGGEVEAPQGMMGLVDSKGRILHLYAHRDSRLSMITGDTRRILAVAYGAPGISLEDLNRALLLFQNLLGMV